MPHSYHSNKQLKKQETMNNMIYRYTKVQIIISEEKTISVFKISISYVAHDLTHVLICTYMLYYLLICTVHTIMNVR